MSKAKKTWLPVVIVLVLAALILLLAFVGSKFKDEETLSETPAPTETITIEQLIEEMMGSEEAEKTPAPETSKAPQKSSNTGSGSKSSASSSKSDKTAGEGSDIYRQWSEFGQRAQEGLKDAADNVSGALKDIGKPFTPDSDGGVLLTPQEFSDGVRGVIDGLTGGAGQRK